MADDAVFRRCLLCLAVVIIVVGYNTLSFKKMLVTYFVGLAAISGVLLPDWDFFDRDPFQWTYPLTVDQINRSDVLRNGSTRFRFYPIRTMIYGVVYAFGFYKWWTYVTQ
ncbi:signal peptidase complex-like protein DTM1 [Amaranthus tricolor]|uniref:signal peptidase complex-like protein DTM1 n=1 Tax=Amaranthus tricolor TaxID=29722 RepID=UPI002584BB81|nr:signal peptidase complex-like protein DTM1 [Amaranthus tricolor]